MKINLKDFPAFNTGNTHFEKIRDFLIDWNSGAFSDAEAVAVLDQ